MGDDRRGVAGLLSVEAIFESPEFFIHVVGELAADFVVAFRLFFFKNPSHGYLKFHHQNFTAGIVFQGCRDHAVNIEDMVYLVEYMFNQGPIPCGNPY